MYYVLSNFIYIECKTTLTCIKQLNNGLKLLGVFNCSCFRGFHLGMIMRRAILGFCS